jgi:hypothetical protein
LPRRLNAWVNAPLWVRGNTPKEVVFAVDSRYFKDQGVDAHGFRAISMRIPRESNQTHEGEGGAGG